MVGSRVIDRVTAHFKEQRDTISVDEWGDADGPLLIYADPMTLRDQKQVMKFAKGDEIEAGARLIILKCQDKDGNPLFDISHLPALMRQADGKVLQRLVAWLMQGVDFQALDDSIDAEVGNS